MNKTEKDEKKIGIEQKYSSVQEKGQRVANLEKRIVGILATFPKETKNAIDLIREDNFQSSAERSILQEILKKKGEFDIEKLKESIPDYELQKLLEEAVFEIEVEADQRSGVVFDPTEELKEALGYLKKVRTKEKILKISKDIREQESAGNKHRLAELMREFQGLSEEISE